MDKYFNEISIVFGLVGGKLIANEVINGLKRFEPIVF